MADFMRGDVPPPAAVLWLVLRALLRAVWRDQVRVAGDRFQRVKAGAARLCREAVRCAAEFARRVAEMRRELAQPNRIQEIGRCWAQRHSAQAGRWWQRDGCVIMAWAAVMWSRASARRRAALGTFTILSAAAGAGVLLSAMTMEPPRPPQPVALAAAPSPSSSLTEQSQTEASPTEASPAESSVPAPPSLSRSEPTKIEIPAIKVSADLLSLGLDSKNELAVPPLDKAHLASWYNLGAAPGELGSAVIVGHVDSEKVGPAVFFNLGKLKPGDVIKVHRKDGKVAQFQVDSVKSFLKSQFPTELVYGGHERATLKVITCGGEYDKKSKNYLSNIVVFAVYRP